MESPRRPSVWTRLQDRRELRSAVSRDPSLARELGAILPLGFLPESGVPARPAQRSFRGAALAVSSQSASRPERSPRLPEIPLLSLMLRRRWHENRI